mmetsp:Transcript_21549/g.54338  ORF Transcript_21549/g.54338 Transcript_21549/m.54338 type:complete len:325 (+) Transcript_21549:520-1494(+)
MPCRSHSRSFSARSFSTASSSSVILLMRCANTTFRSCSCFSVSSSWSHVWFRRNWKSSRSLFAFALLAFRVSQCSRSFCNSLAVSFCRVVSSLCAVCKYSWFARSSAYAAISRLCVSVSCAWSSLSLAWSRSSLQIRLSSLRSGRWSRHTCTISRGSSHGSSFTIQPFSTFRSRVCFACCSRSTVFRRLSSVSASWLRVAPKSPRNCSRSCIKSDFSRSRPAMSSSARACDASKPACFGFSASNCSSCGSTSSEYCKNRFRSSTSSFSRSAIFRLKPSTCFRSASRISSFLRKWRQLCSIALYLVSIVSFFFRISRSSSLWVFE